MGDGWWGVGGGWWAGLRVEVGMRVELGREKTARRLFSKVAKARLKPNRTPRHEKSSDGQG